MRGPRIRPCLAMIELVSADEHLLAESGLVRTLSAFWR